VKEYKNNTVSTSSIDEVKKIEGEHGRKQGVK